MDKLRESNLKVRPIKTGEQLFIFGSSLEVMDFMINGPLYRMESALVA